MATIIHKGHHMSITDRAAKALKLAGKSTASLTDERLILQLRGEHKTWRYRYTHIITKKRITLSLGKFPALSVRKANQKKLELDGVLEDGLDPKSELAQHKVDNLTVSWLIDEFITKDLRLNRSQPWHPELLLNTHIVPAIGDVLLTELSTHHITKLVDDITSKGHKVTSNKVLSIIKQMLSYGVVKSHLLTNIATQLKQRHAGGKETPRERNLSFDELKQFWYYLDDKTKHNSSAEVVVGLKLLIMTGQRTGDWLNADWSEFNFMINTWTIPARRYKTGIDHKVHLTPVVLELLKELEPELSSTKGILFNLGRNALLNTIRRAYKPLKDGTVRLDIEPFTGHDLRRTCASRMSDLKVDAVVIEKILGHKLPKILAAYNKGEMMEERREALELWQQTIMNLITNENVVQLSGAS